MASNSVLRCLWRGVVIITVNLLTFCSTYNFDGSSASFVKYSGWVPCHNGTISFEFKTRHPDALLMYIDSGNRQLNDDYIDLKLVRGSMHLVFKLNGVRSMITSAKENLNDSKWHTVNVIRSGRKTTLEIDNVARTTEDKNFNADHIAFANSKYTYVYIGGLPIEFNNQLEKLSHAQVTLEPRLRGSLRNLFYSNCGQPMVRPEMLDSVGIVADGDQCLENNPCRHDGICVMKDNGAQCDCSWTQFTGEFCHIEKQPVEVMFQGSQYLMYDLRLRTDPIISRTDRISFHFKTTHADGLLFYTGDGTKDYLTVCLKNGDIEVSVDLGTGSFREGADMGGYSLDDGQWHHVDVSRNARKIEVWVDGQLRASGSTIGDYIMLTSSVLYVAGSPNTYSLPGSETRVNFKGCMKQVNYFGDSLELDLVDLVQKDHNLITNMGAIVGMCEEIRDSQPVTFTTPGAFIALPRWDVQLRNHGTIEFQFRTTEPDGLLIFNSGKYGTNNADFIAMELMDGYFYLVLNLGSGAIKEKVSKTNVDDGMPHLVYFEYNGQTGLIRVDNHEIEYNTPGTGKQLDLEDMFYIGGLDFERYGTYKLPKEMWAGVLKNGFVGCVQDLVINTVKIDLMTVARKQMQRDIRPECSKISNQCASQPCLHNGVCREGWNRYICDCRSTAYTGKNCEYAATTLTFDKSQYVVVNLPEESRTEADDISLRFRTAKDNGLLVMTRSADFGDSLELFLERGACKLTISAGPKSQTLTMGRGLNDDHWHTVFIKRRGQNIQYWVDPNSPVRATIVGTTTLRVKQIAIGSVGPLMTGAQPLLADGTHSSELLQEHPWFVGDMQQFIFNKNYYFDMAQEPQSEHIRVTARFDSGDALANDAVTFQSQETYVALPHQLLKSNSKHFSISFKFKTSQTSGLILYCGKGPDFLALELENGYMYYVYDMGGGSKRIHVNTPEPLNDNRWHDLSLFRPETDQQQIRIDNNPSTVEDMKGYSGRQFNLKGSLYVGGLAKSEFYALSVKTISSRNGFLGCIAALDINGARIDILETAEYIKNTQDHTVVRGCAVSDVTCQPGLCEHGGVCEKQWNSFICNCDMTTFTGPRCTQQSVTYQIGLGKGLIVFEYPEDERPSTKSDYLALGIRTNLNERAIILRIDSADHDDFIEMELVNGDIYMVYNLGRDSHPIVLLNKKVNDGKYHEIKFVRNEFNAMLQVDYEKQNKTPAGGTMTTFNKQARIMLGGRKTSTGAISQGFQGTISGFVFNGMRILDLLEAGDERLRIEGDVTLIPSSTMVPPEGVKIPDPDDIKQLQSTQGFKGSTPSQDGSDDIIFSGLGPSDCYSDDDDDCRPVDGSNSDDIITPAITVTRISTPKPDPIDSNIPYVKEGDPLGTEMQPNIYSNATGHPDNINHGIDEGPNTVESTQATKARDNGHLNIFLIIGIGAGILVALIILAVALYKFRSREEGSYRVDESQNFAYLEAKKQQSNGNAANIGNGKSPGKKRDVKEWYV